MDNKINFKLQIDEDLDEYKYNFSNIEKIQKNEWAFNFWILDKFFHVDEELIESYITDYRDLGVDCFYFYEDTKELYLIQNKYYNIGNPLPKSYLDDDFLIKPYASLNEGTYSRNEDLQKIFNKFKKDSEFYIYLQIYVTNNENKKNLEESIKRFNQNHQTDRIKAELFMLDDIKEKYYGTQLENKINFNYVISTVNKGTMLRIDPDSYQLNVNLNARYILSPVTIIYKMYRAAKEKNYPIFDANIREYLGSGSKINKKIYNTLMNAHDRNNFFYYNNGITIVCKKMGTPRTVNGIQFEIENPQVVNGCQTVSTIYDVLDRFDPTELEREFKNTFVLVKLLEIDENVEKNSLYRDIVTYNNSQNSIDEKTFTANSAEFLRLQSEFEDKGFLLLIKQSDKEKYKRKYPNISPLIERSKNLTEKFGLDLRTTRDFMIDLEKMLQIILAFVKGADQAYQKKGKLLQVDSDEYNIVTQFIKSDTVTINTLLNLYLFYLKIYKGREKTEIGDFPIPYYTIDLFGKNECKGNPERILSELDSFNNIERFFKIYKLTTKSYADYYIDSYKQAYNTMVKKPIEYDVMNEKYFQVVSLVKEFETQNK